MGAACAAPAVVVVAISLINHQSFANLKNSIPNNMKKKKIKSRSALNATPSKKIPISKYRNNSPLLLPQKTIINNNKIKVVARP